MTQEDWLKYIEGKSKYTTLQLLAAEYYKQGNTEQQLYQLLHKVPNTLSSPIKTNLYNAFRDIKSGHIKFNDIEKYL